MPKVDWSKPIELYNKASGGPYADADVLATDLKGAHPYVVRWTLPYSPSTERVDMCSADGAMLWSEYHVRNKPVVNRKWAILSVTKAGGLVFDSRETKEAAVQFREYRMGTGKYVLCNVVGLEWTEE